MSSALFRVALVETAPVANASPVKPKRQFRVLVDYPNGDEKYIYFPRDGGYYPRGHRSNTNVEYQLILESYDCA